MARLGWNYRKLLAASAISNLGDGVGQIAYPWLASAVTRNPLLISLIAVAQRLPWLVVTLPAGVLTDRTERRRLMVGSNAARTILTLGVALTVLGFGNDLPGPDELDQVVSTDGVLYAALLVATLLLGVGEVLHDNAAQTFMPTIVERRHLEHANGRLYTAETVANQFIGPPLGSLLLGLGFAAPFFVDSLSFAVAGALVAIIVVPRRTAPVATTATPGAERRSWREDLRGGVRWLWDHDLLRTLAITLGTLTALSSMTTAAFVLFCQEVLETTPTQFALITSVAAVGGLTGGLLAGSITRRLPSGVLLRAAMVVFMVVSVAVGSASSWLVVAALLAVELFIGVQWNVITVSLRQAVIPDELLGRVNSVYRFFGWGMMPIGAVLGGLVVTATDAVASREVALRMPWWVAGFGYLFLLTLYAFPRITTERIEATRRAGADWAAPLAETATHDAQTAR